MFLFVARAYASAGTAPGGDAVIYGHRGFAVGAGAVSGPVTPHPQVPFPAGAAFLPAVCNSAIQWHLSPLTAGQRLGIQQNHYLK